jgi:hypothetical protein
VKLSVFILFLPIFVLSQDVSIKPLSDNINTNNAEINFIQINDSIAYFTVISEKEGGLESNIFSTNFHNGKWTGKKYSKFNSDLFNAANISFSDDERVFLSNCDNELIDCSIVYLESKNPHILFEIPSLSSDIFFNTQAFISYHNSQQVLYFVSDRKGGFGGLDIWLIIIDKNGKFGVPINAGSKINSSFDEVTPFYNKNDGMMYFSSNRENGAGGFDIYKAQGSLNLWLNPINIVDLNTNYDDLYVTFYDENNGYFSSNRKGAKFESTNYCCNDIFSFKYVQNDLEEIKFSSTIHDYLPLNLYFHNDEPDSRTMNIKTNKTYKEAYISYFMMRSYYENENPNVSGFFKDFLQNNFNNLNIILDMLFLELSNGLNVEILIKGHASPLYSPEYNQNLSQRRISSVVNYVTQFKNGIFKGYLFSQNLTINESPLGESIASEKISDDLNNKKESIYSIEAMLERKIQIVDVILKQ